MKQKIKDTLSWIGFWLSMILLFAFLGTIEYVRSLEKYTIDGPGIHDLCSTVEISSCGAAISDCRSKKEYRCATNISVEPIR